MNTDVGGNVYRELLSKPCQVFCPPLSAPINIEEDEDDDVVRIEDQVEIEDAAEQDEVEEETQEHHQVTPPAPAADDGDELEQYYEGEEDPRLTIASSAAGADVDSQSQPVLSVVRLFFLVQISTYASVGKWYDK